MFDGPSDCTEMTVCFEGCVSVKPGSQYDAGSVVSFRSSFVTRCVVCHGVHNFSSLRTLTSDYAQYEHRHVIYFIGQTLGS